MRNTDLIERAAPVTIGGRAFQLPRIKVSTVLKILVYFDAQLAAFAASERGEADVDALLASLPPPEMVALVAFLLEPYDPMFLEDHLEDKDIKYVFTLVGAYNDLARIWGSFTFPKPGDLQTSGQPDASPDRVIPGLVYSVDLLAQRYGVSPREVCDWSYEMFRTLSEVVDVQLERAGKQSVRQLLEGMGASPDLVDLPGVRVAPAGGVQ